MRPLLSGASAFILRHVMPLRFPDPPIFIGGAPRSGTTLLLSILGAHPHIHAIDYETTAFHPSYRPEKLLAALLFEPDSRRLLHIPRSKTRYCEKTPANIRHVEEIMAFYRGRMRFINIFRDGRDVVTSRHPHNPHGYWVPIRRWVRDVKFGLKAERKGLAYSIRYEDLVSKPEETLIKLCDYISEPYTPDLLSYDLTSPLNKVTSDAWGGSARPIDCSSICKWQRPEHRARIQELYNDPAAVALLEQLGYH